jgi:signal transduction histidine kinase
LVPALPRSKNDPQSMGDTKHNPEPAPSTPNGHAGVQAAPPRPPFFDRRAVRMVPLSRPRGLLAGMRIRKKLVFLHTLFSLLLAGILLFAIRPAITDAVARAELNEAELVLGALLPTLAEGRDPAAGGDPLFDSVREALVLRSGSAEELGLTDEDAQSAIASQGTPVPAQSPTLGHCAVAYLPPTTGSGAGTFHAAVVVIAEARTAIRRLYMLLVVSLLGVYALVAVALEVFVLPQHVYGPIRRMLAADRAVQEGRKDDEIIPPGAIPSDELGEIMTSRNETVSKLRRQEAALGDALARLETVANDLKRKNHLLENARRNLADADRLASLGMMSAGIAHELNTPLAVLKGLVEKLNNDPQSLDAPQAALMLRVVQRLERLSDSLLDFARARPPTVRPVNLRAVVQEAVTLVKLDRDAADVEFINAVEEGIVAECDPDRMVQVAVNLVRNAVDAIRSRPPAERTGGRILIEAARTSKDGREWVTWTVSDDGPGIQPAVLAHLFEPFVSTRLDARGTGLGLAVAEGIVREHGGVILARNRSEGNGADRAGAVFEVVMPVSGVRVAEVPEVS